MIQLSFWDGRLIEENLGAYVYALVDPRKDEVFYIGLAGGLEDQGNDRPLGHLKEVGEAISKSLTLNSKQTKIKEIWDSGKQVKLVIVRHNLKREEAIHVEAALIDLLGMGKSIGGLTNIVRGHGTVKHSLLDETNCMDFMASPVKPSIGIKHVWLFNISKAMDRGESPFDATVGDWIISSQNCQLKEDEPQYAIGLSRGISRVVIQISKWMKTSDNKKKMEGGIINKSAIGIELFEKDFSRIVAGVGFWQRGRPVRVDLNSGEFLITYGVKGGRSGKYLA